MGSEKRNSVSLGMDYIEEIEIDGEIYFNIDYVDNKKTA